MHIPWLVGSQFIAQRSGLNLCDRSTVWIAGMTENVRFPGILIRVRYPKVPYLNTNTWLYSTITYMCLWLIHIVVWQKSTQFCKVIISQLKINIKIKEWKDLPDGPLVKNLPVNIEGMSVIPGLGTKILHVKQCIWPKENYLFTIFGWCFCK